MIYRCTFIAMLSQMLSQMVLIICFNYIKPLCHGIVWSTAVPHELGGGSLKVGPLGGCEQGAHMICASNMICLVIKNLINLMPCQYGVDNIGWKSPIKSVVSGTWAFCTSFSFCCSTHASGVQLQTLLSFMKTAPLFDCYNTYFIQNERSLLIQTLQP